MPRTLLNGRPVGGERLVAEAGRRWLAALSLHCTASTWLADRRAPEPRFGAL